MQATTIFALFIGLFVVVHFLTLIADRIRPIKKERKVKTTRKNWYCFFAPNVLLGEKNTKETIIRDYPQDCVRKRGVRHQQEVLRLRLKAPERIF